MQIDIKIINTIKQPPDFIEIVDLFTSGADIFFIFKKI